MGQEIASLQQRALTLPFEPQQLTEVFLARLGEQFLGRWERTFVLELQVARLQGRLSGQTPQARFLDYVRQLCQPGRMLALLEEYPVMARALVETMQQWLRSSIELLERLCADWSVLSEQLALTSEPGLLVDVQCGLGDPHREGRTVMLLTFSSGWQLISKPRSLAIDRHFQQLLIWLNERGTQPAFHPLPILDRGSYGWVEYVQPQPCRSQAEVERFYERMGSLLALLSVLQATDIHAENLLAVGEHPVLVDLEMLFQPRAGDPDRLLPTASALLLSEQSLLRTGLLPHRILTSQGSGGIDLSGLGGEGTQRSPFPEPRWQAPSTDQMCLVHVPLEVAERQNRPHLQGQGTSVLAFREQFLAGFDRMYRLLWESRDQMIAEILPRFAQDEIRVVVRDTLCYSILLWASFHPDLLRDALEREQHFDHLWRQAAEHAALRRTLPWERRDLWRGDIPLLTATPAGRTVCASDGEPLESLIQMPALEVVQERLSQMGERDLARQRWLIEAKLSSMHLGSDASEGTQFLIEQEPIPATGTRLLEEARAIGSRLDELAACQPDGANWLDLLTLGGTPCLTGSDLYRGTTGIALFLSYLGKVGGEERFTTLAQQALAAVRQQLAQQVQRERTTLGAFSGLAGVVYLLTHLGRLWAEPALWHEAHTLAALLPPLIAADDHLDIIAGSAGCVLALLSLHAVSPHPETLKIARRCGDRLLSTAQPMTSGVAWRHPLSKLGSGARPSERILERMYAPDTYRGGARQFSRCGALRSQCLSYFNVHISLYFVQRRCE